MAHTGEAVSTIRVSQQTLFVRINIRILAVEDATESSHAMPMPIGLSSFMLTLPHPPPDSTRNRFSEGGDEPSSTATSVPLSKFPFRLQGE